MYPHLSYGFLWICRGLFKDGADLALSLLGKTTNMHRGTMTWSKSEEAFTMAEQFIRCDSQSWV